MTPPRRYQSQPDDMPAPEPVYMTLGDHDDRLNTLEKKVDDLGDSISDAVREIKNSNSSETRKMIAAIAGAAITTIGGVFGAAHLEHPAPPPQVQRSALDMRLDECRPIHEPGSRAECFSRVFDGAPK